MDYKIGEFVKDKGVYVGVLKNIDDLEGNRLSGEFNIWAFPSDLGEAWYKQDKTVEIRSGEGHKICLPREFRNSIARLRGVYGHDGTMIQNAGSVYKAIRDKNYSALSKWQLPLPEVLMGRNRYGEEVQNDNLWAHRDTGEFSTAFAYYSCEHTYLSCLWLRHDGQYPKSGEDDAQGERHVCTMLHGNGDMLYGRSNNVYRARPVRYEPR